MGVLIGASAYTWLIAAVMSLLLAVWLARIGGNVPVVRHLVAFLVTFALYDVANGLTSSLTEESIAEGAFVPPRFLLSTAILIMPAATLGFYGAYRNGQRLGPMDKSWVGNWMVRTWPIAIVLAVAAILFPRLWVGTGAGGPLFLVVGLNYVLFAVLALELTRDAVKEVDDAAKRRSMLFLALGFSFVPAYVASSELLFIDIFKLADSTGVFFLIAHYLAIASGVVLAAMFVILARAALQTEKDEQKVDVAWFMLVLVGPGMTVLIQLLFIAFDEYTLQMSVAIEGVWAMLFPMTAALAVARYESFGLSGDSRPGLRVILFGILFPLAFALGWMAGRNSFPDTSTWVVALIFTGALALFSKVLWRNADKWAGKILGVKDDDEEDEAVQEEVDPLA